MNLWRAMDPSVGSGGWVGAGRHLADSGMNLSSPL